MCRGALVCAGLRRSGSHTSASTPPPAEQVATGERVVVAGQRRGIVRYTGQTDFAPGESVVEAAEKSLELVYCPI